MMDETANDVINKDIEISQRHKYWTSVFEMDRSDVIDPLFGVYSKKITDEQIEALKNGKCLYLDVDGEYAVILYRGEE